MTTGGTLGSKLSASTWTRRQLAVAAGEGGLVAGYARDGSTESARAYPHGTRRYPTANETHDAFVSCGLLLRSRGCSDGR